MTHHRIARLVPIAGPLALACALLLAPAVLATRDAPDGVPRMVVAAEASAAPDEGPSAAPAVPPSEDPQGTIVEDPTFITPTPEGGVLGATRRPELTPPPTDAAVQDAALPGHALTALLAVLAALPVTMLTVGRMPDVRQR